MKNIEIASLENIAVPVPAGINDIDSMREEIKGYTDVFLLRSPMPINIGINTLYEVAVAYLSRAKEIEMNIKEMENKNLINRSSPLYKFRTGELSAFIDIAKEQTRLGSRRITVASMVLQEREIWGAVHFVGQCETYFGKLHPVGRTHE